MMVFKQCHPSMICCLLSQESCDALIPSASQSSPFYQPAHAVLPRRGSTTSEHSVAQTSPGGSTHRLASQLLRLESRASDPFSIPTSSRQGSLTVPDSALAASGRALSLAFSRGTRDSVGSQASIKSQGPSELGPHDAHVVQSRGGSGASTAGGGGGSAQSTKSDGGPPSLDRASLSILQVTGVMLILGMVCA